MQLSAQNHNLYFYSKRARSTQSFFHILQYAYTYSNCFYSHFMYGFEDVGKDQTTVNINHLQLSLQFNELVHLEPAHRVFIKGEGESLEQLKVQPS